MEKDIDLKLYNEYLKGDRQAFEILYKKYKNNIQYFIFNIVKDYQKSEDITQEVFIYVLQNKKKNSSTFKYYLYLVAKSKALNYIHTEKRRSEIVEQYIKNDEDIEKDVIDVIITEENKKEVMEVIEQLDIKYKNAIYLVNIEGLSYKETAEILGETMQNTKSLIHRGKKELKNILIKKGCDDGMNKIPKILLTIMIVILITTGTVFAIVRLFNYFEYKTLNLENFENNNGFLYKKIYTYEEYSKYKEQANNLLDISENDFNENFVLIIVSERTKLNGLTLKEYDIENETLNIELIENIAPNEEIKTSGVVILIPKVSDREHIHIEKVSNKMNMSLYSNIKSLPNDYTKQQALEDNCLIIDQNEKKSYNIESLINFINKVEQHSDTELRIYQVENEKVFIQDVKYISNSKFIITYDYTRYRKGELSYETDEIYANKIDKEDVNSFNEKFELYTIEDNNHNFSFGVYID